MMLSILSLLLFLSLHISLLECVPPPVCSPGRLRLRGSDLLETARGKLFLAVFMPLQCSHCHKQLKELALISDSMSDVRIIVIVPSYEASSLVIRTKAEFPRLSLEKDEDENWKANGASNHDQLLFDRCGRLARSIVHPRSDVTSYRDTLEAIGTSLQQAQCGWCQYDSRSSRGVSAVLKSAPPTVSYQNPITAQNRQTAYEEQQRLEQQRYQEQIMKQRQKQREPVHQQNTQNQQYSYNHQNQQQTKYPQQQQQQQQQQYQQGSLTNSQSQTQYAASDNARNQYQQSNQQWTQSDRIDSSNSFLSVTKTPPPPEPPLFPKIVPSTAAVPIGSDYQKTIYTADEDYTDYLDEVQVLTTPFVQTQIPTPTTWNPLWPTPLPGVQFNPALMTKQFQIDQPFGPILSENNIPCTAYTDDICFQQQEKLGRSGVSKCCSKGIYFTDLCVPGKCSNSTVQLCCFQKFLQARYACCEDPKQSDGRSATNKFNQCCYEKFVAENECCTTEAAATYWPSTHEVCYPNTKVDYSNIKMEVRFSEGVRVVDLNHNRLWDYECRHGTNRIQYAYLP